MIKRHEVTPIHIGRCVRFSVVELSGFVERLSSTPASAEVAVPVVATVKPRSSKRRAATWAGPTLF